MARPEFPRLAAFQAQFATDKACRGYLAASRWPDGFRCPRCGHVEAYKLATRAVFKCTACSRQTSVTAGTVMHRTRLPLTLWFWAAYLVATHTPGISALQLQWQLGLSRYETAWTMLQRLRAAMVQPRCDRITGPVEVDETYVGGLEVGRLGGRWRDSEKAIVVGAVQVRGQGSGRLRLAAVDDVSAASLVTFVEQSVAPGSIVLTDGRKGYLPLGRRGYDHRPKIRRVATNAARRCPRIHRVFSYLKTWLRDTHHGVSPQHLPEYLDEFVFRFNRRRTPMAAFQALLGLTAQHQPVTHQMCDGGAAGFRTCGPRPNLRRRFNARQVEL